jgi:SulP family sulfate permease
MPLVGEDAPDDGSRGAYDEKAQQDPSVIVYRISGALFFGAASSIGAVLERIGEGHRNLVVDFTAVPFVDSTGAQTIESLARKAVGRDVGVYLTGTSSSVKRELAAHGIKPPLVRLAPTIERALQQIHKREPALATPAPAE